MKVKVENVVEVSDEQRQEISQLLGVKHASRDQLKEFLWRHGENWAAALASSVQPATEPDELESLI